MSKLTLEQVRDQLRDYKNNPPDQSPTKYGYQLMIDAIDAALKAQGEPVVNMCDGCQRDLPVVNGIHRGNSGYDLIACTADRYEPPTDDRPTWGEVREMLIESYRRGWVGCDYDLSCSQFAATHADHIIAEFRKGEER